MIDKDAVRDFLARELKDYFWMKSLSRADLVTELKARLREEGLPWPFITTPRKHQLVAFLIGMRRRRFLWGYDMGGGKTKIVTDLLRYHRAHDGKKYRMLACVPKRVHIGPWESSIAAHSDLTMYGVSTTSVASKLEALLNPTTDVVVIDYAGLELALSQKAAKPKKGRALEPNRRVIAEVAKLYPAFALDEIHNCSNHRTLRYECLSMLTRDASICYGMTGTLTGRNPTVLWPQFFLVDRGQALGTTLGMFRAAFFIEKPGWFGGADYKLDPKKTPLLRRAMAHSSLQYEQSEFNDLPELHQEAPKLFRLPSEQKSIYVQVAQGQIIDGVRVPTDGVYHRMRELCSGFVRQVVNGVSVVRWFDDNPKHDLLLDFIEEVPPDRKGIIFFDYSPSGQRICETLRKLKQGYLVLDGTTKDSQSIEARFRDDPKARWLVANNGSGAEGINAQVANYVFYWELPTSPIKWLQGLKRAHRDGQQRRVTVRYALAKGSVEEKLFGYLHEGRDLLVLLRAGGKDASLFDVSDL